VNKSKAAKRSPWLCAVCNGPRKSIEHRTREWCTRARPGDFWGDHHRFVPTPAEIRYRERAEILRDIERLLRPELERLAGRLQQTADELMTDSIHRVHAANRLRMLANELASVQAEQTEGKVTHA
jgi:hypothetical protein